MSYSLILTSIKRSKHRQFAILLTYLFILSKLRLELQNIRFGFSKGKPLLDNISLVLEMGKIYVLMGSNGAGKTSLLNLISGFVKPVKGNILFNQNKINNVTPHQINRIGISRTFQDLRLITRLTVIENVLLTMKGNPSEVWYRALLPQLFYRKTNAKLKKKASDIIENCFLSDVTEFLAGDLSFGQQKLLTLACCIANDAELLLLDEPMAGINPEYQNRIIYLIQQLKARGKTILLIEHQPEVIERFSDTFLFLFDGQLNAYSNYTQLKLDPSVAQAYL